MAGALAGHVAIPQIVSKPFVVLSLFAAACGTTSDPSPSSRETGARLGGDSHLVEVFRTAAARTDVPAEVIAATSYATTRMRIASEYGEGHRDGHGQSSIGLLGMTEPQAARAIALTGLPEADVHTDELAGAVAAGALLRDLAGPVGPTDLAGWHDALAAYGSDRLADQVERHLERGFRGKDRGGRFVVLSALRAPTSYEEVSPGIGSLTQSLGYPGIGFDGAHPNNYGNANRGAAQINSIIIHTMQGYYAGTISWFKNPAAGVSAHYNVSELGDMIQQVGDEDIAYHDACNNSQTIGIEHAGFVNDPDTWYTEAMYASSAKLTAWLADAYGIPKDRAHIMGHGEAPDCSNHTDPGGGWNWDHYMALVNTGGEVSLDATYVAQDNPSVMVSGEESVVYVEFTNTSSITWGLDATRLGTAEPADRESPFFAEGNWMSPSRATGADHSHYSPGSVGRFTFLLKAPQVSEPTTFVESFQLVQNDTDWFGPVVTLNVQVNPVGWTGGTGDLGEGDEGDGDEDDGEGQGTAEVPGPDVEDDRKLEGGGCAAGGGGGAPATLLLLAAVLRFRRRRIEPA